MNARVDHEANARKRFEEIRKAVDGREDMVWASFQYGCKRCKVIESIGLGVGVEGPVSLREKGLYLASPFGGPACANCGGETVHVNWNEDRNFPPIDAVGGFRYFRFPRELTAEHILHWEGSCFCGDTVIAPIAPPIARLVPPHPRAG